MIPFQYRMSKDNQLFFSDRKAINKLLEEAQSWVESGTPFHPHGRIKGVGVDCVWLVALTYMATGFVSEFDPPKYRMDEGSHLKASKVIAYILETGRFKEIKDLDCTPMIGDLLCFRVDGTEHHVGLMVEHPQFLHIWQGYNAMFARIDDSTFRNRLTRIFRPLAK